MLKSHGPKYKTSFVGKAYDSAAVMCGKHTGFQAKIKVEQIMTFTSIDALGPYLVLVNNQSCPGGRGVLLTKPSLADSYKEKQTKVHQENSSD